MARTRGDTLDLNFDGLTDALTNLVGTLILFVFLLIAVSRQGVPSSGGDPPPTPPRKEFSVDGLLQRVNVLRAEIRSLDAPINRCQEQIPRLEERLERLEEQAEQLRRKANRAIADRIVACSPFSPMILARRNT